MAAQVVGGTAGRAAFIVMAVVVLHTMIVAVICVHGVRLCLAVAKQDRQRRGDALQRQDSERRDQHEFFQPERRHVKSVTEKHNR